MFERTNRGFTPLLTNFSRPLRLSLTVAAAFMSVAALFSAAWADGPPAQATETAGDKAAPDKAYDKAYLGADPYVVLEGTLTRPKPVMATAIGDTLLVPRLMLHGGIQAITGFPVDRYGTELNTLTGAQATLRLGLMYTTAQALLPIILKVDFEGDGHLSKAQPQPIEGDGYPGTTESKLVLRKASLAISYKGLVSLSGGFTTSHWGLGLLANDGGDYFTPGSASFNSPYGGDVVIRAGLSLGPFRDANDFTFSFAYDTLWSDDAMLEGDSGFQFVAAASVKPTKDSFVGVYGVRRHQEAGTPTAIPNAAGEPKATDVWVVDLTGYGEVSLSKSWTLRLEAEVAVIFGETELSPTSDFPIHDVLQVGAAARLEVSTGYWGLVMDIAFASGDQNLDDNVQNAFKADQNFQMGFIYYQNVMAAMTARATFTAADPDLVGRPSEDLERFPTRGSVSNSVALFPRLWWRPLKGFEIFFGSMFAFSHADVSDPLNTRVNGGEGHNAFGGNPGTYQGAEVDFGLRYNALIMGSMLSFGLDAGVFFAGDALDNAAGESVIDPVYGARLQLRYEL